MASPFQAFFWLLMVFFLFGTLVTRIGHAAKTHLTQSSIGGTGGEGARTSAQGKLTPGPGVCEIFALTLQSLPTPDLPVF